MKKLTLSSLLFAVLCLLVAAPAEADSLLYDNGFVNGTINGYLIGAGGYQLSESFTVSSNSTLTVAQMGLWVPSGETPTSVDWAIGTVVGGSDIASGTSTFFNQTIVGTDSGFYDIYQSSLDIGGSVAPGTYWFSPQNGTESGTEFGGSAVYWDQNNGPSIAYYNLSTLLSSSQQCMLSDPGGTCSESFQIFGSSNIVTPEPSSVLLLGTGLMGLAGVLRRRVRL